MDRTSNSRGTIRWHSLQSAPRERAAAVRTAIADGSILSIDVEDRDGVPINRHHAALTRQGGVNGGHQTTHTCAEDAKRG